MGRYTQASTGFSFIEVLTATALLGIVVGIASIELHSMTTSMRLKNVGQSIQFQLRSVRSRAILVRELIDVSISANGIKWEERLARDGYKGEVPFPDGLSMEVTPASALSNGEFLVTYDGLGLCNNLSTPVELTFRRGSFMQKVSLNPNGLINRGSS